MSRHGPNQDRITVARLIGTATRYAREPQIDEQKAIDELIAIATEKHRGMPPRLRVDLLSDAAGSLMGGHKFSPTTYWSAPAAARVLIAAGADPDLVDEHTTATFNGLRGTSTPGIGNRP